MNGPGMSLFNGAGSIHLNTSIGLAEEEEAIEEERRRKEELHNELNKQIGDFEGDEDFEDDEDETMDDSAHFNYINTTRGKRNATEDKVTANIHQASLKPERTGNINTFNADGGQGDVSNKLEHHHVHHMMSGRYQQATGNGLNGSACHHHLYQSPTGGGSGVHADFPVLGHSDKQLESILQMKCQEVQKLNEELSKCREEASNVHEELYNRLNIAEAERHRSQLSLQQSMELVENGKHRIVELEHEVSTLNKKLTAVNARNEELSAEVTAVTANLIDTQNRLQMAQLNKESAHNTDALFKALHERHAEDTERLEKELMKARKRLQEKESENNLLEKRCQDLEHSKESLLIEKGSTINQLAMDLKEAQDRLTETISERNTARLQCKDLAHKFEETAKELVEYRTKCIRLQEEQSELDEVLANLTDCEEVNPFVQLNDKPAVRFSAYADKVETLRCELKKRILTSKEQIEKLNRSIQQRDVLLEQRKDKEDVLKRENDILKVKELKLKEELKELTAKLETYKSNNVEALDTYKGRCSKLEIDLKQAKADYNSLLTKHTSLELKYEELNSEVNHKLSANYSLNKTWAMEREKLNYQLKDAQRQVEEFKNTYIEICGERERLLKDVNDLKSINAHIELKYEKSEADDLKKLLEIEKKNVEELQKSLLDFQKKEFDSHLQQFQNTANKTSPDKNISTKYLEEIFELKTESEKLQQVCVEQKIRIANLCRELEESQTTITKLKIENELQSERDRLIADLKEKGKQFEKYIENQKIRLVNRKDVSTCTEDIQTNGNMVSEMIQTSMHHDEKHDKGNLKVEALIREEIAKHYAFEINKMEKQYATKINEMEDEFRNNIMKLSDVLKIKSREISSLQEVVMSERGRYKDLVIKMSECQHANEKNEKLLCEYKNNINKYKAHIQTLTCEINELNKRNNSFNQDKLKDALMELDKIKEKYRMLKKCALKYKEYNMEKDKHVEKELEKVKNAYDNKLKKMQEKLQDYLKDVDAKMQI